MEAGKDMKIDIFGWIPNLVKEMVKGFPSDNHQRTNLLLDILAVVTFLGVLFIDLPKEQEIYKVAVAVIVLLFVYWCLKTNASGRL